jgi:NAD(P)-dependent dehydrogenase (short-subunit alcohol dehydrogenase family)
VTDLQHTPRETFQGRAIVVTGASSGLGRACAIELASRGARLVLVGRNVAELNVTRAAAAGDGHEIVPLDLNEVETIAAHLTPALARIGRVYGLCNAAGVVETRPLSASTPELVARVMRVNVMAALEVARVVTNRLFMDSEGGSLVFFSSVYGAVGAPGQTAYAASKGAIAAAVRCLAIELAKRRIRVNSISPGLVHTPMADRALGRLSPEQIAAITARHPLGVGTVADIAGAAAFLLAPDTRWISGTDLPVDGAYLAQ